MPGELPTSTSPLWGGLLDSPFTDASPNPSAANQAVLVLFPSLAPTNLLIVQGDTVPVVILPELGPGISLDGQDMVQSMPPIVGCDLNVGFAYERDVIPVIKADFRKMQARHQRNGG
jgi:hypothetical protein